MSTVAIPSPDPTTAKPPHPRRWIPLSLRMFVSIVVLLAAGSALWIGVRAYREHVAIREITRAIRDSNRQDHNSTAIRLRGPEWWQELVLQGWISAKPTALFYELFYLELDHVKDADATLRYVGQLPQLSWLSLDDTQVSDAGLVNLIRLANLRILKLDNTQITDAGLVHLKKLDSLVTLSLRGTRVTDAGIAELQNALPRLTIDK